MRLKFGKPRISTDSHGKHFTPQIHGMTVCPPSNCITELVPVYKLDTAISPYFVSNLDVGPNFDGFDGIARDGLLQMQNCKNVFDIWVAELDRILSTMFTSAQARNFQNVVSQLRNDADAALLATRDLIADHQQFSTLMAKRLGKAAEHEQLFPDEKIEALGEEIHRRRGELKMSVEKMQDDFDKLLDILEMSRTSRRAKPWWKKLWTWIKKAYLAVVSVAADGIGRHRDWLNVIEPNQARIDDIKFRELLRDLKCLMHEQIRTVEKNFEEFQVIQNVRRTDVQIKLKTLASFKLRREDAFSAQARWQSQANALNAILSS